MVDSKQRQCWTPGQVTRIHWPPSEWKALAWVAAMFFFTNMATPPSRPLLLLVSDSDWYNICQLRREPFLLVEFSFPGDRIYRCSFFQLPLKNFQPWASTNRYSAARLKVLRSQFVSGCYGDKDLDAALHLPLWDHVAIVLDHTFLACSLQVAVLWFLGSY